MRTNSARLEGVVVPNGVANTAAFEWGPLGSLTNHTTVTNVGNGSELVRVRTAISITNPAPFGIYEYRIVATNALGIRVAGARQRFTTGNRMAGWGENAFNKASIPAALSNAVSVSAGWNQSFAIRPDGSPYIWGDDYYGIINRRPYTATNLVQISGGWMHALALNADGKVVGWGTTYMAQLPVPSGMTNMVMVAAGKLHSLALRANGQVVIWGSGTYLPEGLNDVVAVAAGANHNLALRANGTVVAWGTNDYGQLDVPPGLSNVVAVAAGGDHSLALRADGTVRAWGRNDSGQTNVPAGLSNVVAIAAGWSYSLVLTAPMAAQKSLVAWGDNSLGQCSAPSSGNTIAGISAGLAHSWATGSLNAAPRALPQTVAMIPHCEFCEITLTGTDPEGDRLGFKITSTPNRGSLWQRAADGSNGAEIRAGDAVQDQAGRVLFKPEPDGYGRPYATFSFLANDGLSDSSPAAVTIDSIRYLSFTSPPTGIRTNHGRGSYSVRLRGWAAPDGRFSHAWFQWGGLTNQYQRSPAQAIGGGGEMVAVEWVITNLPPGGVYGCHLVVSNAVTGTRDAPPQYFTTGRRPWVWGEYAFGQTNVPVGLDSAVTLGSGPYHLMAVDGKGEVWGWGSTNYSYLTRPPAGLNDVVAVAVGAYDNVALRSNGTVVVWGDNYYGQTDVPAGLSNVVDIAVGDTHGLALREDGVIVAWGNSDRGLNRVPAGVDKVVAVAAGPYHNLALCGDGRVVAWGKNDAGQTNVPSNVSNVVAVAAGSTHSLALTVQGTVLAWGANSLGQCSVPAILTNEATAKVVAIAAGSAHSLALRADGRILAWGTGGRGQTNTPSRDIQAGGVDGGGQNSSALAALTLTQQPAHQTNAVGQPVCFRLGVYGTPPLCYQWQHNGDDLAGATNASLCLSTPGLTNLGAYRAVITDLGGSVTSSVAQLFLSPRILNQPAGYTGSAGDSATLEVVAEGSPTLRYQWLKNGVPIAQTNSAMVFPTLRPSDTGDYRVVVANPYGSVTSAVATLAVTSTQPPQIQTQPQSKMRREGEAVGLTVAVAPEPALTYQWQLQGTNLPGATASAISIPAVSRADAGDYGVLVANSAASVTSAPARIAVLVPIPAQSLQPGMPFSLELSEFMVPHAAAGTCKFQHGNLPFGADIAADGRFTWKPSQTQSGLTTNVVFVVEDTVSGSSATNEFRVRVGEAEFELVEAVFAAGSEGASSMKLHCSAPLAAVTVAIQADFQCVTNLRLANLHADVTCALTHTPFGARLEFSGGGLATGGEIALGQLAYDVLPRTNSVFTRLLPTAVTAETDSGPTQLMGIDGLVAIIGADGQPLLKARPMHGSLARPTLYGPASQTFRLLAGAGPNPQTPVGEYSLPPSLFVEATFDTSTNDRLRLLPALFVIAVGTNSP